MKWGLLLIITLNLSACSSNLLFWEAKSKKALRLKQTTSKVGEVRNDVLNGSLERNMDDIDRSKMLRALDKAPGTTTRWTNQMTDTDYTVTPTQKVTVNGNPICRTYVVTKIQGSQQKQANGTACVGADGGWKSV